MLYTGDNGMVAHECILDLREITKNTGVTVDDVAKRLADYGFHAPTMSFPVAGTLMVEPTESESLAEVDAFCEAMIAIKSEIDKVGSGVWPVQDNPLRGAPHTAEALIADEWNHPYTRAEAAYPLGTGFRPKVWPRCVASTVPMVTGTWCARARRSRPSRSSPSHASRRSVHQKPGRGPCTERLLAEEGYEMKRAMAAASSGLFDAGTF